MNIDVNNYTYQLPPEKIAQYPLAQRDQSKLLYYTTGKIEHKKFKDLPELLPPGSTLFFNDTKVIPARLIFHKTSGAYIEIFLLNPIEPSPLLAESLQATETCAWKCTIGNLKKWNVDTLSKRVNGIEITAKLVDREAGVVKFIWSGGHTFAEVVQCIGNTPLPPYLKRDPDATDEERYQTVYSNRKGAVAAPTAGLHFTPAVLATLRDKRIPLDFLSLHVSAGTFLPIKVTNALDHRMHEEQMVINRQNIETLLQAKTIVAVGTTSLRTLESLYWYGVKLIQNANAEFNIGQHDAYTLDELPTAARALQAIRHHMDIRQEETLTGETSIYIVPGYRFRLCSGLITNFHQPASTLILLVAAFIGDDWRKVYDEALANDYRFLSYGDSSLLLADNPLQ
jgi:S-adenosylmethionine:tRNA ribosyltransferase-isomerase